MDNIRTFPRKTMPQADNSLHVDNALIEDINMNKPNGGSILISYKTNQDNMFYKKLLKLIVGRDTIIKNKSGAPLSLWDLNTGMQVDAEFSEIMARSFPPQAKAFQITANTEEPSVDVTIDRVVEMDTDHGFLTTGNPYDKNDQIRFIISNDTIILDQNGNQVSLGNISTGQMVRIVHAAYQTMSIPPQTPAFLVQIL